MRPVCRPALSLFVLASCCAVFMLPSTASAQSPRPARSIPSVARKLPELPWVPLPRKKLGSGDLSQPWLPSATGTVGSMGADTLGKKKRARGSRPFDGAEGHWIYWWEFNADRFLRAPAPLAAADAAADGAGGADSGDFFVGGAPAKSTAIQPLDRAVVRGTIVPALATTLRETQDTGLKVACLIALAKAESFRADGDMRFVSRVSDYLDDADPHVRAAAVLAVGLGKDPRDVPVLLALATKKKSRDPADNSDRIYALHALGHIAPALPTVGLMTPVADVLCGVLDGADEVSSTDRVTAALYGLSGLKLRWNTRAERRLSERVLHSLMKFFTKMSSRRGSLQLAQAHAPRAIARLLEPLPKDSVHRGHARGQFVAELLKISRRSDAVRRSAILALGMIGTSVDDESSAAFAAFEALARETGQSHDPIAAHWAYIALGQHGGALPREVLLKALRGGSRNKVRPWAALGLGLWQRRAYEDAGATDAEVVKALGDAMLASRRSDTAAACAVGLGLTGSGDGISNVKALLRRENKDDLLAGFGILTLAMLDRSNAYEEVETAASRAFYRPDLERRVAQAFGVLGKRAASAALVKRLSKPTNGRSLPAIAASIGQIGDRRATTRLMTTAQDATAKVPVRITAVAALGDMIDGEELPWTAWSVSNVNYLAHIGTLHDGRFGVFDLQ